MEDLIVMQDVLKVYPPNVVALDRVSVSFKKGEIHSLVGENGAGKSTLMKVLYGLTPRDAGQITYNGKPIHFHQPGEAIASGIGMVHQEILLVPEYSVWENIVLGREPTAAFNRLDHQRARQMVKEKIDEFSFNLDPDDVVSEISVAAKQKVEILKLLYRNVSVLILDEPTAVLAPQEIPQLFDELRRLRADGRTILFISHRLDEVLELSDRVTVMRRGKKIDTVSAGETSKEALARSMIGREVIFSSRRTPQKAGEKVVEIDRLSLVNDEGRELLKDISLEVRAGEIVGIAGVEGNGQLELGERHHRSEQSRPGKNRNQRAGHHPGVDPGAPAPDLVRAARPGQDGCSGGCHDHGKCGDDAPPPEPEVHALERSADGLQGSERLQRPA